MSFSVLTQSYNTKKVNQRETHKIYRNRCVACSEGHRKKTLKCKELLVLRMKCDFELKPGHFVYYLRLDLLFYLASFHTALEREGG